MQERQSEQLFFFVNRHGQVYLKRNLRKKMGLIKLEDIVQHEDAMTQKFLGGLLKLLCDENSL